LVHLEVLVADTLLILPNPLNGHDSFLRSQEPRIELIVRHQPKKDAAHSSSYQSNSQKDDFPRLNCGTVFLHANGYPVRNKASKNLSKSIETEPNSGSCPLFLFRIPL
jgi:hypothetical protein